MNPCLVCGTPASSTRCPNCEGRHHRATPPRSYPKASRQSRGLGYQHQREARKLYGLPCHWCGEPADTADHLIPRAMGGESTPDNLVPACRSCNSRRGAAQRWH